MRREHQRIGLARGLEPLGGEAVAERSILLGELRVRALAQERLAEAVLLLAGEAALAAADAELPGDERGEVIREQRGVAAEQVRDGASPE
ncbi:hypothetical protein ACSRUE_09250 [Sorangium sp. KYC3313]|uniref:hypothetical protein n=1 Tax=Sorangium sp. KYC3313 TaxID=3449740 RepID=UPI003F8B0791